MAIMHDKEFSVFHKKKKRKEKKPRDVRMYVGHIKNKCDHLGKFEDYKFEGPNITL